MRKLFVRTLSQDEKDKLFNLLERKDQISDRAKIILLSEEGYEGIEINRMLDIHVVTVRKWIKRFNEKGLEGICKKRLSVKNEKFTEKQREEILKIALTKPRDLGLKFSLELDPQHAEELRGREGRGEGQRKP